MKTGDQVLRDAINELKFRLHLVDQAIEAFTRYQAGAGKRKELPATTDGDGDAREEVCRD